MKRKAGIPPVTPRQPPGPPGFGYLVYVVQTHDGTKWHTISYAHTYMEAHLTMISIEKQDSFEKQDTVGHFVKQLYLVSHEETPPDYASFAAAMTHDV